MRVIFGGETEALFDPGIIKEFNIIEDIESAVPILKMVLQNPHGMLEYFTPPDKTLNQITVELSKNLGAEEYNTYDFTIFTSKSDEHIYSVEAYLDVRKLFNPLYARGFEDSVSDIIQSIVEDELQLSEFEISSVLDYRRILVQPNWNNAKFFKWLKENLWGRGGESCFYSFIKNVRGKPTFVFKNLDDFYMSEVSHTFVYGDSEIKDAFPIYNYGLANNLKLAGSFGRTTETYSYFDYDNDVFVPSAEMSLADYPSLSEYFLIDGSEETEPLDELSDRVIHELGRSNGFTSNFAGKMYKTYFNRITHLGQIWITSSGIPDVSPGNVVKLVFLNPPSSSGEMFSHSFNGYWLVKRVVQMFGSNYLTRLLLIRSGVDVSPGTTLVKAAKVVDHGEVLSEAIDLVDLAYSKRKTSVDKTETDTIEFE